MSKKFKIFLILLVSFVMLSNLFLTAFADTMNDIEKTSAYARESVSILFAKGIISGDEKGNYNPKKLVNRAEALKIIINSTGIDTSDVPDTQTFKDVPKDHWAYKYVETAYKLGITKGVSADTFGIKDYCTREQIAAFYTRAVGMDMSRESNIVMTGNGGNIVDFNQISNWAKPYAIFMLETEIIKGNQDKKFMPKQIITKEQLAVMADRFMNSTSKINEVVSLYHTAQNTQVTKNQNQVYFASSKPYTIFSMLGYIEENGNEFSVAGNMLPPGFPSVELWGDDLLQVFAPVEDNGRSDYGTTSKKSLYEKPFIYYHESLRNNDNVEMVYQIVYKSSLGDIGFKVKKPSVAIPANAAVLTAMPTGQSEITMYVPWSRLGDTYKNLDVYQITNEDGNRIQVINTVLFDEQIKLTLEQPMVIGKKYTIQVDGLINYYNVPETKLNKFSSEFVYGNKPYRGIIINNRTNNVKQFQDTQSWSKGPISVFFNGDEVAYIQNPERENGDLLVPGMVFDYLRLENDPNLETQEIGIHLLKGISTLKTNKPYGYVVRSDYKPFENHEQYKDKIFYMKQAPKIVDGKTMLPFGLLVDNTNAEIYTDKNRRSIYIRNTKEYRLPILRVALLYSAYSSKIDKISIEAIDKDAKTNAVLKKDVVNYENPSYQTLTSLKPLQLRSIAAPDEIRNKFERVGKVKLNGKEVTKYTAVIDDYTYSNDAMYKYVQAFYSSSDKFRLAKMNRPYRYIISFWVDSDRNAVAHEIKTEATLNISNDEVYGSKKMLSNGRIYVEYTP